MTEFIKTEDLVDPKDRTKEDRIVSCCVMHVMSQLPDLNPFMEEWTQKGGIEVHFTINGREFSLGKFLEEFERQLERIVAKQAEQLLDDRVGKLMDFVHEVDREARAKFKKEFGRDLGDYE
jgi:hypothetical protein